MASRGVNNVILLGRLGGDPELRTLSNGGTVANVGLATSETWKDKNTGELQERTEWHRLVFYQRLAEIVGEYLHKGSKLYVEGRLQTRQWEKDGVKHYTTEIIVDEMQMLDSRPQEGQQGGESRQPATPSRPATDYRSKPPKQAATLSAYGHEYFDDPIPF